MKAMVQDRYGSADVLELRDVDEPAIGDDEVLVRVRAAAVNPADWGLMRGVPYILRLGYGLRTPNRGIRGTDMAGEVTAIGRNVTLFQPGDEVYGSGRGAFAEYVAAAEGKLSLKPTNLSFEEAAAVPMVGTTALKGLRDTAKLEPGQRVLINGASGGVGTFAVQIAKSMGAEVTGVCSTRNGDMVASIGADHVIDYTKEDFTRSGQRYDVILDNVASHSLSDTFGALTRNGLLLPNNGSFQNRWLASIPRFLAALVMSLFKSQRAKIFLGTESRDDLMTIKHLIETGEVTPVIDRSYQLSETAEAIEYVGEGHARGKVVITV
jgi:NADPH:quinone reductase-like Zn-dependent oxidoreductase